MAGAPRAGAQEAGTPWAGAPSAGAATAAPAAEQPWQVEVCTYITGTKGMDPSKDLGATFLQLGLDAVLQTTGRNLLCGAMRTRVPRLG